ncbi:hypothetical protein [Nostoc sp.]|uniref:hypothetical protein n=1 Tax=Nostoc sp. TaxID=1180 RepID=UPI002FF7FF5D
MKRFRGVLQAFFGSPKHHLGKTADILGSLHDPRFFEQIQAIATYRRGGKILVLDRTKLDAIAQGEYNV